MRGAVGTIDQQHAQVDLGAEGLRSITARLGERRRPRAWNDMIDCLVSPTETPYVEPRCAR
jgi:hypothetical protein